MYSYSFVCIHVCMYKRMYLSRFVCMYFRMYVCMYVSLEKMWIPYYDTPLRLFENQIFYTPSILKQAEAFKNYP